LGGGIKNAASACRQSDGPSNRRKRDVSIAGAAEQRDLTTISGRGRRGAIEHTAKEKKKNALGGGEKGQVS